MSSNRSMGTIFAESLEPPCLGPNFMIEVSLARMVLLSVKTEQAQAILNLKEAETRHTCTKRHEGL